MTSYKPIPSFSEVEQAAFWAKVNRTATCWLWAGTNRYGTWRKFRAHRVAYTLTHGSLPADLMVCHRCDNPACVRPDHLFVGTAFDNMRDMVKKGRHDIHPGEQHPLAKLTRQKVARIRDLHRQNVSIYRMARMFRVGESTVRRIVRGQAWPEAR